MPLGAYFRGKGRQVMGDMKDQYGEEAGERVFYATANKRGLKPGKGVMDALSGRSPKPRKKGKK